jgi:hypothetical protein
MPRASLLSVQPKYEAYFTALVLTHDEVWPFTVQSDHRRDVWVGGCAQPLCEMNWPGIVLFTFGK